MEPQVASNADDQVIDELMRSHADVQYLSPIGLAQAIDQLSGPAVASQNLRGCWSLLGFPSHIERKLVSWLGQGIVDRDLLLPPSERERLPQRLRLFRGCQPPSSPLRPGRSWTRDRDVALEYAKQWSHLERGILLEALCDRDNVLMICVDGETTYVIDDPRGISVKSRKILRVTPDDLEASREEHAYMVWRCCRGVDGWRP